MIYWPRKCRLNLKNQAWCNLTKGRSRYILTVVQLQNQLLRFAYSLYCLSSSFLILSRVIHIFWFSSYYSSTATVSTSIAKLINKSLDKTLFTHTAGIFSLIKMNEIPQEQWIPLDTRRKYIQMKKMQENISSHLLPPHATCPLFFLAQTFQIWGLWLIWSTNSSIPLRGMDVNSYHCSLSYVGFLCEDHSIKEPTFDWFSLALIAAFRVHSFPTIILWCLLNQLTWKLRCCKIPSL